MTKERNLISKHARHPLVKITAIFIVVILCAVVFSGCTSQQGSNTIKIEGAFALEPMMNNWTFEYHKLHQNITFDINANGAGLGMADLLNRNGVDIEMDSKDVNATEKQRGAFWVDVAKDAVVATINQNNPFIDTILARGITKQQFKSIFITGNITTWEQLVGITNASHNHTIVVYTRSDVAGSADTWAKYMGKYTQNDIGSHVEPSNRLSAVNGDNSLAAAIQRDQNGIGYNNIGYVYTKRIDSKTVVPADGIRPVPIDINGNGTLETREQVYANRSSLVTAINKGIYPSPPARLEHLVAYQNFTGAVKEFVYWILTDGQQYVLDNGYVPLPQVTIDQQIQILQTGKRP